MINPFPPSFVAKRNGSGWPRRPPASRPGSASGARGTGTGHTPQLRVITSVAASTAQGSTAAPVVTQPTHDTLPHPRGRTHLPKCLVGSTARVIRLPAHHQQPASAMRPSSSLQCSAVHDRLLFDDQGGGVAPPWSSKTVKDTHPSWLGQEQLAPNPRVTRHIQPSAPGTIIPGSFTPSMRRAWPNSD